MDISQYFKEAMEHKASDLHLVAGSVPALRIGGELVKLDQGVIDSREMEKAVLDFTNSQTMERLNKKRELDFSREFFGCRFRINLHYQESKIALAARLIPAEIPLPVELGFDDTIYKLTRQKDGLILITGPSGCGKSTTLASMINIINKERHAHIITIEDPIEYLFKEEHSIIEQRELGFDTLSFASALKYALRQDPNVIMVGEMRDLETIQSAITAAETGHLVLSTVHTLSAAETISRIVDVFPSHQQNQILIQLSSTLRAVIAQQLLTAKNGGRVAAREIMINNQAISNLIRSNQVNQIYSVIQTGQHEGMITMNKSIDKLLKQKLITEETAEASKVRNGTL